jgi:outer membrane protein assembly factor BamB
MVKSMNSFLRTVASAAAVIAIAALTGCSSGPDSNNLPPEPTLVERWTHDYVMAGGIGPKAPPVQAGDRVLFSGEPHVTALNASDGSVRWNTSTLDHELMLYATEIIVDGGAVFASHVDVAKSWNLESGKAHWTFSGREDNPFFDGGFYGVSPTHFYGFGRWGAIFVVDRNTGELTAEWKLEHSGHIATYHQGAIYIGLEWVPEDDPGQPHGLLEKRDATTGEVIWQYETELGGFVDMAPIVENGVVYAGTNGGYAGLFAVDAETGAEIWRNDDAYTYAGTHDADRIYVNDSINLQAIDKKTGQTIWKTNLESGSGMSQVAVLGNYVYHPHAVALFVLDARTGEIVHVQMPPDGSYFWEVGVGPDAVYAQTSTQIIAYEPFTPPVGE